jgi:hypothetical protein
MIRQVKVDKDKVEHVGQVSRAFKQQHTHRSNDKSAIVFICYSYPFLGFLYLFGLVSL